MINDVIERLSVICGKECVIENEMLSKYTTFKVGGPARVFLKVRDKETLKKVVCLLNEQKEEYFVLGHGSNLLVSDKGYEGIVIFLTGSFSEGYCEEEELFFGAAAGLTKVCTEALKNDLTGLEFAYGIPGYVGGAMVMNAGAYGGEMKDIVKSVEVITKSGEEKVLSLDEMEFGYRSSIVREKGYIVTGVRFQLKKGNHEEIENKMNELLNRRKDKQPLEFPSAGSTFKRPEGFFAGKLIEDSGLRGARVGGASVSSKHCGFVINDDNASAEDISKLIMCVQKTVKEKYDVLLETEVIRVGEFG